MSYRLWRKRKEKDSIYSDHFILSSLHFWNRSVFLWEDKLFFKDTHIKLKDGRLVHICPRNSYYSIYSGIFVFLNLCVYILGKMYFSVLTLYFLLGFRNGCVRDRAESFSEHERFAGKRA